MSLQRNFNQILGTVGVMGAISKGIESAKQAKEVAANKVEISNLKKQNAAELLKQEKARSGIQRAKARQARAMAKKAELSFAQANQKAQDAINKRAEQIQKARIPKGGK